MKCLLFPLGSFLPLPIRRTLGLVATSVALSTLANAQEAPPRPKIFGISHIAFYVTDMPKTLAFYEGLFGFQSPFSLPRKGPNERLVWIKINDRQNIELFPASETAPDASRLAHIALEVEDGDAMRLYLKSKGVAVPNQSGIGKIGNKNYFVRDPNGNRIEIVQNMPDSWTTREKGKFMSDARISVHIPHVGVTVGHLDESMKFYGEILGFSEIWRGGSAQELKWVNMRVPEGTDYIEFMLYDKVPTRETLLGKEHVCLEVPDVAKAAEILKSRPLPPGCKPPDAIKTGVNGKRQINYFDPDGTRVELMEPATFDGKAVPSSTVPPPAPLPPYVPESALKKRQNTGR